MVIRLSQERFPISESLKVVEGITIYKTDKWWAAVTLIESFGRKQVATYLWNKKGDQWKRRQKLVITRKSQWLQIRDAIEKLLPRLP